MKTCSICKTEKSLSEFYLDKRRVRGNRCKDCNRIHVKAWREKNRDSYNAKERERYAKSPAKWANHLRRVYGISPEVYANQFQKQGGCCAICKASAESLGETLAVDHNHATKNVRGLLCANCNRMLGFAADRPRVLRAGANYLIKAEPKRQRRS